jgi:hypothetical protein
MSRAIARYGVVSAMALAALWAFASYLHPSFTGELAGALLRCN